jgi:RecQ-mediated genome instability protein 1
MSCQYVEVHADKSHFASQGWLQQCYAWVIEEHNLNPATDMGRIKEHVESQLLMSDLTDSMIHGSGLPDNLASLQKGSLSGPPILVQIMALTEIGHSAFSLMNVRQTKVDRADLSGLAHGDSEDEADEGPVPNYPRSMLQFELSDGEIKLNAIEYRKILQLDLENTPLGFKVRISSTEEAALLKASFSKSLDTTKGRDHQTRHRIP